MMKGYLQSKLGHQFSESKVAKFLESLPLNQCMMSKHMLDFESSLLCALYFEQRLHIDDTKGI